MMRRPASVKRCSRGEDVPHREGTTKARLLGRSRTTSKTCSLFGREGNCSLRLPRALRFSPHLAHWLFSRKAIMHLHTTITNGPVSTGVTNQLTPLAASIATVADISRAMPMTEPAVPPPAPEADGQSPQPVNQVFASSLTRAEKICRAALTPGRVELLSARKVEVARTGKFWTERWGSHVFVLNFPVQTPGTGAGGNPVHSPKSELAHTSTGGDASPARLQAKSRIGCDRGRPAENPVCRRGGVAVAQRCELGHSQGIRAASDAALPGVGRPGRADKTTSSRLLRVAQPVPAVGPAGILPAVRFAHRWRRALAPQPGRAVPHSPRRLP